MAKTDYSTIVIPSSPKDRVIVAQCLEQAVASKTRTMAEAALQKDIKKRLNDEYNLPTDLVNQWINDLMDPEKRLASEAKFEAIEAGRSAFIDQASANKKAVTKEQVELFKFETPKYEGDVTQKAKELLDNLSDEEEEIVVVKETTKPKADKPKADKPKADKPKPKAKDTVKPDVKPDVTPEVKTEITPDDDDDDEFDTLFDELTPEPETIKKEVVADDDDDIADMFAESAADLGNSPTNEDFEAVNKAAEASALELADDDIDDEFSDISTTLDAPITKDSKADVDDIFDGLEEFDSLTNSNIEADPEPAKKNDIDDDDDLDSLFDDL
jgi:hypothetical protein